VQKGKKNYEQNVADESRVNFPQRLVTIRSMCSTAVITILSSVVNLKYFIWNISICFVFCFNISTKKRNKTPIFILKKIICLSPIYLLLDIKLWNLNLLFIYECWFIMHLSMSPVWQRTLTNTADHHSPITNSGCLQCSPSDSVTQPGDSVICEHFWPQS